VESWALYGRSPAAGKGQKLLMQQNLAAEKLQN
jgi:hypothetical protein